MSFPKYPAGSLSIPKGPETRGHARQDVRRIRNGRHEIDREVLWRQIIARLDGGLVNEAMYYKLEQGRIAKLESQRKSLQAIKAKVEKAAKAKAALESVDGPIRWKKKKRIDFCGGWWKMKPRPTPSEPGFVVYTKELMQPDVPLTKREKAVGLLLGILASVLFGISIEIVKLLTYRYQNSIEMILFYQFTTMLLSSLPPFFFYRYVSSRRAGIWGRLLGDDQYINYKRGAMTSVRALWGVCGIVGQYYAADYMVPGDVSLISLGAPLVGAFTAMLFKKRPKEIILTVLFLVVGVGYGYVAWPQESENHVVKNANRRGVGFVLAFVSMLAYAANHYILRFLRYVHWSITQLVYGFSGFLLSLVFIFTTQAKFEIPLGVETTWFLAASLCTCAGELLWQVAHKYQTIPTLGAIRFYFEVLVITYIEFIAFGWAPLVLVGIGGSIVGGAVIIWAIKEAIVEARRNATAT